MTEETIKYRDAFPKEYAFSHKDVQLPVATGVTDGPALRAEYERGFVDGMQKQMQSSVDRAVNAMSHNQTIADLTEALRSMPSRNDVLEEVAAEFDKMKVFGDTAQSFAMFVRGMKQ